MARPYIPAIDRLYTNSNLGEHWVWKGGVSSDGYGVITVGSRASGGSRTHWRVHRFAYTELVGPIPEGMQVLHHCDITLCWKPDHLFLGDHPANMADKTRKGRQAHGETHYNARLTTDEVVELRRRRAQGETLDALAAHFGVNKTTVSRIAKGQARRNG